jgi:hypothetical protein
LAVSTRAQAAEPLAVVAANRAVGAIVMAAGGREVRVSVDGALTPIQLRIGGAIVDIGQRVRLPEGARAARFFLDDARSAPRLGANIRNALVAQRPELKETLAATHKAWTRSFARKVMEWNRRLERSPLHGQRVADAHGRRALLTWAGASVEPKAANQGPAALARLPREPARATLAEYIRYIDALVSAVS